MATMTTDRAEWTIQTRDLFGNVHTSPARYSDRKWALGIAAAIREAGFDAGRRMVVTEVWIQKRG